MTKLIIPGLKGTSSRSKLAMDAGSKGFGKAFDFLKKHFDEPIGTRDLCKVSKLSRRGLHKAFQQHIEESPGRELRRRRIEHAKTLLIKSDYELKVIAKMCGYRSQNSFWVSFRDIAGEAPGKYRIRFQKALPRSKSKLTLSLL
jgi:transcriptional regulator GlxA family with amidase domain